MDLSSICAKIHFAFHAEMLDSKNHSTKCFIQVCKTISDLSADQMRVLSSHLNTISTKLHSFSFLFFHILFLSFLPLCDEILNWLKCCQNQVYLLISSLRYSHTISKQPEDSVCIPAQFNVLFNDNLKLWVFPVELKIGSDFDCTLVQCL